MGAKAKTRCGNCKHGRAILVTGIPHIWCPTQAKFRDKLDTCNLPQEILEAKK